MSSNLHYFFAISQCCEIYGFTLIELEEDLAVRRLCRSQDGSACGRLATTGFSNQPQGLSSANVEAHAIHGFDRPSHSAEYSFLDGKVFLQVVYVQ